MKPTQPYDAPRVVLEMLGGPHDGERILVPRDREPPTGYMFAAVVPEPSVLEMADQLDSLSSIPLMKTDLYSFTGRILDDGARAYSYSGRS